MLIFLGGFLGSGRSILAHRLAARGDFHLFDLSQKKLLIGRLSPRGVQTTTIEPDNDAERMRLYQRAAQDFPMLAKLHEHVVIHGCFHRAKPREYFLSEARKYFNDVHFIWIDAPEASVESRLIYMKQKGLIRSVLQSMKVREKAIAEFEPFPSPPLTFRHGASNAEGFSRFDAFLEEHVGLAALARRQST